MLFATMVLLAVRTWLIPDVLIVALDWIGFILVTLALSCQSESLGEARS